MTDFQFQRLMLMLAFIGISTAKEYWQKVFFWVSIVVYLHFTVVTGIIQIMGE